MVKSQGQHSKKSYLVFVSAIFGIDKLLPNLR